MLTDVDRHWATQVPRLAGDTGGIDQNVGPAVLRDKGVVPGRDGRRIEEVKRGGGDFEFIGDARQFV